MTKTKHLAVALAVALLAACGSGEGGGAGSGGAAGDTGPTGGGGGGGTGGAGSGGSGGAGGDGGKGGPACPPWEPEPFPADLGVGCAAGSNLSLCLMDPTSSCQTGLCLYHADDPTGTIGHCTVECDPGDASSCPDGYACQVEECEEAAVCVRTEPPGPSRLVVRDGEAGVLSEATFQARTSDDSTWWMDAFTDFAYERRADGEIVEHSISTAGQRQGLIGVGTDLFVITTQGAESRIYRLRQGSVSETSTAEPIESFFADGDGRLVVSGASTDWRVTESLELEELPGRGVALDGCTISGAFQNRGFFGACGDEAMVGSDLTSIQRLPGVEAATIVGLSDTDVWGRDGNHLVHFDGTSQVVEVELPSTEFERRIVPIDEGVAVVMARDAWVATKATGCWEPALEARQLRSIPWRDEPVLGLGPALVGWVNEFDFYELDLSAD